MFRIKFLLIGLIFLVSSCKLDDVEQPISSFSEFEDLFNLAYNNTRSYINGYFNASEVSSDEMIPLSTGPTISEWQRLYQHTWTPSDQSMLNIWNEAYEGVSFCILALNSSKNNESDIPANFIAELRALRAFYYYILMDSFGGLSILDDDFVGKSYPARSTREATFSYIETELLEVLPDLSENAVYGRINQDVAQAILAKLYLNAAVYTGTPQWEKCITACKDIIENGAYNLLPDYFDNFISNNHTQASDEIIFYSIYNLTAVPTGQQMDLQARSLHHAHFGIPDQQSNPFFALPTDFYYTFDHENDYRTGAFLIGPQFTDFDESAGLLLTDSQGNTLAYTLDIPEFPVVSESTGVRVLKYQMDQNRNGLNANNDFAIFRLSDILLMQAEAENELGNTGVAIELINRVRTRGFASGSATLEDSGFSLSGLREIILKERGNELFWEGFRRQDLIRHNRYCGARLFKEVDDDCEKRKLFAIPQVIIDLNPLLLQNPGY